MGLRDLFRRRARQPAGLEGVAIKLRPYNLPHDRKEGSAFPGPLWWGLVLGIAFYLGAHYSIATGVWPVHGTAPGPGALLMRDVVALLAWLILLGVLRAFKYQGRWAIVVLPILIFCIARPALFQVFTDPAYQAVGGAKARANDLKATRSRLYTIDQEYTPQRKQEVFAGPPPPLPDPFRTAVKAETSARGIVAGILTNFSVFLAPLAVLAGFLFARHRGPLRWFRDHRLLPFIPLMGIFLVLTLFFTSRATGKVGGTTPWELFLPIFIGIWAATLADDAYNLGQAGQAFAPRRLLMLFVYGALPVLPFVWIHELGLSLVLSVSLAAMLLVGTRRGWWAAVMLVAWLGMVFAAFHTDERSQIRFQLAYHPYRDASTFATPEAQEKWAGKLHQMKLFDANVLAGDLVGAGAGRGHGETAPNSADDGYITLFAAQWGLLGGLALVLVYTFFLVELLGAAVSERGAFERTLVTGVAMIIGVPFWLAVLGGMRVIPLTGVAAAFAANGGAKLLASSFAVGIVAGLSHRRTEEDRLDSALAPPEPAVASAPGVRIV